MTFDSASSINSLFVQIHSQFNCYCFPPLIINATLSQCRSIRWNPFRRTDHILHLRPKQTRVTVLGVLIRLFQYHCNSFGWPQDKIAGFWTSVVDNKLRRTLSTQHLQTCYLALAVTRMGNFEGLDRINPKFNSMLKRLIKFGYQTRILSAQFSLTNDMRLWTWETKIQSLDSNFEVGSLVVVSREQ